MKVISICNHKGGTAKSATARALGDVMARDGYKVLLIDADPQGSLSVACKLPQVEPNLSDVVGGATPGKKTLKDIIRKVEPNLFLAPSHIDLAVSELGLHARLAGRELVLSRAIDTLGGGYDVVIIDCPPSLSLLVVNALMASQGIIIPTKPTPIDIRGLKLFLDTIETIKQSNPGLEFSGILPTFYDERIVIHRESVETMVKAGWPVLNVTISQSIRVAEANGLGDSIFIYDPTSKVCDQYKKLGGMLEKWLKEK